MFVLLRSTSFNEGIMLINKMAVSSTDVWDSDKISRLGTCSAKIPNAAELTLVPLIFRLLNFAPTHATISIESSPIIHELRLRCSITFIRLKKKNLWRPEWAKSRKDRKFVFAYNKASASFRNVAPERISFAKGALSSSIIESTVQLLMSRHSRDDKLGNFVTLVQARFRWVNFGNILRTAAPLFDILLPQRSMCCSFFST